MRGESWDGFGRSASFLILLLLTQTCGSRFLYLITISPDCTLLGFLEHCFSYIFLDFFLFTFSFLQGFFLWFLLPIWFLFKFQSTYFLLFFFSHLFCPHFLCTFGLLDQAGRSYLPVMISGFVMRSCAYSNTHNCTKKKTLASPFLLRSGLVWRWRLFPYLLEGFGITNPSEGMGLGRLPFCWLWEGWWVVVVRDHWARRINAWTRNL